jgi:hypothetical protein
MKNAHVVQGWKLTPASSKTHYGPDKSQTIRVTKLDSGKGADGYHVQSPSGACFFVQKWDGLNPWTSQKLQGDMASAFLQHGSPTLKLLLERLRNATRVLELESQLRASFAL